MRYIFLIIIIGASIAAFSMVIMPQYKTTQALKEELVNADARYATAQKLKDSRQELINKYNNISKADLDNIKTLLPDSVDNIRLIIQLDSLATKNGLASLRNVQYDEVKQEDTPKQDGGGQKPYGEFQISFDTAGQYKNFLSFLSDLEQNLRLVDVMSVDFSTPDGGTGVGDNMRYRVQLKTYWLKK